MDDRKQRMLAARLLAQLLGDPEQRKLLVENGYGSGQQIVLALESDTVAEVLKRVTAYAPPVAVAIYFPGKKDLRFCALSPEGTEPGEDVDAVGQDASIGMLYEAIERNEHSLVLRRSQWDSPLKVTDFVPA